MKMGISAYLLGMLLIPVLVRTQTTVDWGNRYSGGILGNAYAASATSDGGCVFGDQYWIGSDRIRLVKISAAGEVAWDQRYPGQGSSGTRMKSMAPTPDGGFIMAGDYWGAAPVRDLHIVKTDSSGNFEWQRMLSDSTILYASSISPVPDGGYIVSCTQETVGTGNVDLKLLRLDSAGTMVWSRQYGGPGSESGHIVALSGGGFVSVGGTSSAGAGGVDAWVLRLNGDGDTLWTLVYGGPEDDQATSVIPMPDGGFVIGGWTRSFGAGGADGLLIRTDNAGDTLWTRTFGGSNDDVFNAIGIVESSSLVLTGTSSNNPTQEGTQYVYVVGAGMDGEELWSLFYGWPVTPGPGIFGYGASGYSVAVNQDRQVFVGGQVRYRTYYDNFSNAGIVRLTITPTGVEAQPGLPDRFVLRQNFPNPFNPSTTIEFDIPDGSMVSLRVFTIAGEEIAKPIEEYLHAGSYRTTLDMSGHPSGVYYYRLGWGGMVRTARMVLIK